MRFQGRREADPYFKIPKASLYRFTLGSRSVSTLSVIKDPNSASA